MTGDFGRTTGERFADLLTALDRVAGIERYRISSIEPNLLTDDIIGFCAASAKFQPHFHMPLQSGSDRDSRPDAQTLPGGNFPQPHRNGPQQHA